MSLIKIKECETIAIWRCLSDAERNCFCYAIVKDIPAELIGRYVIATVYYKNRCISKHLCKVWRCYNAGCISIESLGEWLANKTIKVVVSRPKKSYWWFP